MRFLDPNLDASLRVRCEAACDYLRPHSDPHMPYIRELALLFGLTDANFSKYCGGYLKRSVLTFETVRQAHDQLHRMVKDETNPERAKHLSHVAKLLGLGELLGRWQGEPVDFQDAKRLLAIVVGHVHPRIPLHQTFWLRPRAEMLESLAHALRQIRAGDWHINGRRIKDDANIAAFVDRLPRYLDAIEAASHAIGACARAFGCFAPPATQIRGHLHMVAKGSQFDVEELLSFAHSHSGEKEVKRRRPIPVSNNWYVVARAAREIDELRDVQQHTIVAAEDYSKPPPDFRGPRVLAVVASALRHQQASWVVSFDLVVPEAQHVEHDVRAIVTGQLRWATDENGQLRPTHGLEDTLSQLHEALRHIGSAADIERMIRGVRGIIELG